MTIELSKCCDAPSLWIKEPNNKHDECSKCHMECGTYRITLQEFHDRAFSLGRLSALDEVEQGLPGRYGKAQIDGYSFDRTEQGKMIGHENCLEQVLDVIYRIRSETSG